MIFKNFDSKTMMDNYKFDIKTANQVTQRLDDVKGMDEIKQEIEDLIK